MRVVISVEQFEEVLHLLVGKPLSAATVTKTTQSRMGMGFGCIVRPGGEIEQERVEGQQDGGTRAVKICADGIKSVVWQQQQYERELTLLIWCNWRIGVGDKQIVCGSQDSAEEGKPIQFGIREMIGDTVAGVSLNSFLDLLVVFNSGKELRLFCDQSGHANNEDSYELSTIDGRSYGVITGLIESWEWKSNGTAEGQPLR